MKKTLSLLFFLALFVSCKEEVVPEPDRLIEKKKMVDIMYDLSLLEAIKYQNPTSFEAKGINPTQYIFKKYKIDSLQFAQSNNYYAADYVEYKLMFDKISKRLGKNKVIMDSLVEKKRKKTLLLKKKKRIQEKDTPTIK